MTQPRLIFVSRDAGLLAHWQRSIGNAKSMVVNQFEDLSHLGLDEKTIVWVDLGALTKSPWENEQWQRWTRDLKARFVAADSNPQDERAIVALDAGCSAYCHAFADVQILRQVAQVVEAGHVWIGTRLMQRLIQTAHVAAKAVPQLASVDWRATLTNREAEVATLAAHGASNLDIAVQCRISERTVKAHLSAIFQKLHISDRLQLALKVHGIRS